MNDIQPMRVLVACEESQEVCKAFRALGHEAYSCDIEPCSGGHPEWHLQVDALEMLKLPWDMIIAHPPCTYLTNAGNKWFKPEYQERFPDREQKREDAVSFFMAFWNADCPRVAIENPQGIMSSRFRKPDQYIEPYMFGDSEKKKTGLWLRGLPALAPTNVVEPIIIECASGAREPRWHMESMHLPPKERSKVRSKTFPGIARAMAEQWGGICDG